MENLKGPRRTLSPYRQIHGRSNPSLKATRFLTQTPRQSRTVQNQSPKGKAKSRSPIHAPAKKYCRKGTGTETFLDENNHPGMDPWRSMTTGKMRVSSISSKKGFSQYASGKNQKRELGALRGSSRTNHWKWFHNRNGKTLKALLVTVEHHMKLKIRMIKVAFLTKPRYKVQI